MPFADISPLHDQEYFADGVAEEILNALSRVEGLKVAGHTSSFSFKGKGEDTAAIAGKLHVAHPLEGSVRKEGNRVRISAQLVSARDGFRLWSETFDREITGVFVIQDEIAQAVTTALRVKLLAFDGGVQPARRTPNPDAYNEYLLARSFAGQWTREGFERAAAAYERSLSIRRSRRPGPGLRPRGSAMGTTSSASTRCAALLVGRGSRPRRPSRSPPTRPSPTQPEA